MSYKLLAQGQWWNVNKQMAKSVGIEAALLLSELIGKYLYHKENSQIVSKGGLEYFFYTSDDIEKQTTLSYTLQKKNIKILEKAGFIKTCLMGIPAKLHFTIDENKISEFLKTGIEKNSKLYIKNKDIKNKDKYIDGFDDEHMNNICKTYDKYMENENENIDINKEGVQGEIKEFEVYPFDEFWNDYEKKVGDKEKIRKKFEKLSDKHKMAIKDYIPNYKKAQPDKKFRKNPETFLSNKSWEDELIYTEQKPIKNEHRHRQVLCVPGGKQGSSTL